MSLQSIDGIELPDAYSEHREQIQKCQKEQLESLRRIADVCAKYGLRYYLIVGSALGAARHGGFIPWDDDIDIAMPRPDYEKLARVIFTCDTSLKAFEWKRTPDYWLRMMKVGKAECEDLHHAACAVDVFPIDGMPRVRFIRKLQSWFNSYLTQVVRSRKGILRGSKGLMYRIIGCWLPRCERKIHAIEDFSIRHFGEWTPESFVGVRFIVYGDRELRQFKVYGASGGQEVAFAGDRFCAPVELEKYLEQEYGDWRKLPPIEKRLPHHVDDDPWFYSQLVKK